MVDVAGLVGRELAELSEPELLVARRCLPPGAVPAVELVEEEPQHGGLELVEARVVADRLELLLLARAVEAQERDPVGQRLVGRRHEASVSEPEQVLRREEAEGRQHSGGGDTFGAEGLGRVLDDRDLQLLELAERHGPPEEVHGHQGPRPAGHLRRHVFGIQVQRDRIDVGEDGSRAAPRNRLGGRIEREGGADHLVAGTDLERVEREHERVGPVRDADRPRDAQVRRGLLLERLDVRTEDEHAGVEHLPDPREDVGNQALVLAFYVN